MYNLRLADESDWARLYAWRNAPSSRENMRNPQEIPLDEHMRWLKESLKNKNRKIWIASGPQGAFGVGRADLDDKAVELSIIISPQQRGAGLANVLLNLMCEALQATKWSKYPLRAMVKPGNLASLRAFASAGFEFVGVEKDLATLEREHA